LPVRHFHVALMAQGFEAGDVVPAASGVSGAEPWGDVVDLKPVVAASALCEAVMAPERELPVAELIGGEVAVNPIAFHAAGVVSDDRRAARQMPMMVAGVHGVTVRIAPLVFAAREAVPARAAAAGCHVIRQQDAARC
jgi:hypothetical protein